MSWTMNSLVFETADKLLNFVESDEFAAYVDQLDPFVISIDAGDEDGEHVYGKLQQREPAWLGETKLSQADWENTYSAPFMQPDKDPTDKQKQNLDSLKRIEDTINVRLNKE